MDEDGREQMGLRRDEMKERDRCNHGCVDRL